MRFMLPLLVLSLVVQGGLPALTLCASDNHGSHLMHSFHVETSDSDHDHHDDESNPFYCGHIPMPTDCCPEDDHCIDFELPTNLAISVSTDSAFDGIQPAARLLATTAESRGTKDPVRWVDSASNLHPLPPLFLMTCSILI
jgi:hypothetical protein